MRLGVAASLSIIVLISVVPLAAAHDPTEGENEFADDATALRHVVVSRIVRGFG